MYSMCVCVPFVSLLYGIGHHLLGHPRPIIRPQECEHGYGTVHVFSQGRNGHIHDKYVLACRVV